MCFLPSSTSRSFGLKYLIFSAIGLSEYGTFFEAHVICSIERTYHNVYYHRVVRSNIIWRSDLILGHHLPLTVWFKMAITRVQRGFRFLALR